GGFGNNLLSLANNEVAQKEIKMTDRQKAAVKKLSDDQRTKSRDAMQKMRQQTGVVQNQAAQQAQMQTRFMIQQQANAAAAASALSPYNPMGQALVNGGYGFQPQLQMAGGQFVGGQPQVNPLMQQQVAQAQGRMAANAVQQQSRMMMRQAMQQMQQAADNELARILDKNQMRRLREIQLQQEGPRAVLREDVAQKLEINQEQAAEIQQALSQAGQERGQLMRQNFQYMRSLMPNPPGGNAQGGPGGQANPFARGGRGGQGAQAQGGFGGQGGNGGQGGQAGQGRFGGQGGFGGQAAPGNQAGQGGQTGQGGQAGQAAAAAAAARAARRDAMQKIMEKPEVKAKMQEFQDAQAELRQKEYAMVFKAMDRRQVSAFKKMLGKPFDVDSLRRGFFRGPANNGPGGATNTAANSSTTKTDSSTATGTTPAATAPRRRSLRERRGLAPSSSTNSPN
ncbi:MAG: hypothetical protein ACP5XB_02735, partial [Isosphaeraceae bacterium]